MTIAQAKMVFVRGGHSVYNSPAAPGRKWIIHFKGQIVSPHCVYLKDFLREAEEARQEEIQNKKQRIPNKSREV